MRCSRETSCWTGVRRPCLAATVPFDSSGYIAGPIVLTSTADEISVTWPDESGRNWLARFSVDPARPLMVSISQGGTTVLEQANPVYRAGTGKRRGGWDQFFDFPESAPEGTHRVQGDFRLTRAAARSDGKAWC
jgi:hypothetical protein